MRGPAGDGLQYLVAVEARCRSEGDCFGQSLQQACDRDLVDHLGQLSGARFTDMDDACGVMRHQWMRDCERLVAAAAHDRKLAAFRAGLPARYRCIDDMQPLRRAGLGEPLCEACRDRGMIDEQRACAYVAEGAMRAEAHCLEVIVGSDAGYDRIGIACGRGRCCGMASAIRFDPGTGLVHIPVMDDENVPGSREMPGDRSAHHAEPDESDPCHAARIRPDWVRRQTVRSAHILVKVAVTGFGT